jgi:hypothetical protein
MSNINVGLSNRFFDYVCSYVGSQNLYLFDLTEWGVAIDDKNTTFDIKCVWWNPIWNISYLDGSEML